jgi:hypothetical protein
LYSISLLSLTATFLLIARCSEERGRFGCCCDDGEEDNLFNHFTVGKIVARIKRFLCVHIDKQAIQQNNLLNKIGANYLDRIKGD